MAPLLPADVDRLRIAATIMDEEGLDYDGIGALILRALDQLEERNRQLSELETTDVTTAVQENAALKMQRSALLLKLQDTQAAHVKEAIDGAITEIVAGKSLSPSTAEAREWNSACDHAVTILQNYLSGDGLFQQLTRQDVERAKLAEALLPKSAFADLLRFVDTMAGAQLHQNVIMLCNRYRIPDYQRPPWAKSLVTDCLRGDAQAGEYRVND